MKRSMVGLFVLLLTGCPVEAASVSASVVFDNSPGTTLFNPIFAEVDQRGINGPDDFGIDLGFAQANLLTGQMRFLATDGLQTGDRGFTVTRASTNISETLTLFGPANGSAETFTLGLSFEADLENFAGLFPVFLPNFFPNGETGISAVASLRVIEETPLPSGIVSRTQTTGILRHDVRARIQDSNGDSTLEVTTFPPQTSTTIQEPSTSFPGGISRVSDVRAAFDFANPNSLLGLIEIDFLVAGSHTFLFEADATGFASGALGILAGVSSLNTASLGIIVPDGGAFTSASGLFLTEAPTTAVPLPAPLGLLAVALAFLFTLSSKVRNRRA